MNNHESTPIRNQFISPLLLRRRRRIHLIKRLRLEHEKPTTYCISFTKGLYKRIYENNIIEIIQSKIFSFFRIRRRRDLELFDQVFMSQARSMRKSAQLRVVRKKEA